MRLPTRSGIPLCDAPVDGGERRDARTERGRGSRRAFSPKSQLCTPGGVHLENLATFRLVTAAYIEFNKWSPASYQPESIVDEQLKEVRVVPTAEPASNTILVVEDNDVEREGLTAILRRDGFFIQEATTGDQALENLRAARPNLILLDMLLPEGTIDGWAVLANIRANRQLAEIPVIIVTGLTIASVEWCKSHGALDIVKKPIDTVELISKVRRHLA